MLDVVDCEEKKSKSKLESVVELTPKLKKIAFKDSYLIMLSNLVVPWTNMHMENWANECTGVHVQQRVSRETHFLGIIGRDPSVSKSNQLHVDIFQVFLH